MYVYTYMFMCLCIYIIYISYIYTINFKNNNALKYKPEPTTQIMTQKKMEYKKTRNPVYSFTFKVKEEHQHFEKMTNTTQKNTKQLQ